MNFREQPFIFSLIHQYVLWVHLLTLFFIHLINPQRDQSWWKKWTKLCFLQPEEGGKQHQQHNSQYLEKIINILQSSPILAYKQVRKAYHSCSEFSGMIAFSPKRKWKVTNTIFFNVTVDACVILNWKLGRGSLSSVKDFFIFSHSSLCFLVNVLIFDLQSTDDLMSPFNGLLENSRVSYHFLRFIYFFSFTSVENAWQYTR